jgi:hypothetical protein
MPVAGWCALWRVVSSAAPARPLPHHHQRHCTETNAAATAARRALELLRRYYEGQLASLDEDDAQQHRHVQQQQHKQHKQAAAAAAAAAGGESQLLTEQVKPRAGLPPLLVNLAERPPEPLHYLGVSYGLTQQLYGFWRRAGFQPLYLRQSASDVTGEHTVVMLRPLQAPGLEVKVRGLAAEAAAAADEACRVCTQRGWEHRAQCIPAPQPPWLKAEA